MPKLFNVIDYFVVTHQKLNAVNERLKYHEEKIDLVFMVLPNTNALTLKTGACHNKQQ